LLVVVVVDGVVDRGEISADIAEVCSLEEPLEKSSRRRTWSCGLGEFERVAGEKGPDGRKSFGDGGGAGILGIIWESKNEASKNLGVGQEYFGDTGRD
jgi:hypothetical protein